MSELSVSDHLEGILSDFEALKRSFDIEDVDDIPSFSATSPLTSPFSPSANNRILNKINENQLTGIAVQPAYQSQSSLNSNSSPAQSPVRTRIASSLSFNQGTSPITRVNGNIGASLGRVLSFQNRPNPNGFSSSGPASDNDSLHSSTSSLDYQCSTKLSSLSCPSQAAIGQVDFDVKFNRNSSPALKKFSSQSNMFHSEADRSTRLAIDSAVNHGSMPSLDLHIAEDHGAPSVSSLNSVFQSSPAWNSASLSQLKQNSGAFQTKDLKSTKIEPSLSPPDSVSSPALNLVRRQQEQQAMKFNKFPIDLDSLMVRNQESSASLVNSVPESLLRTPLKLHINTDTSSSRIRTKEGFPQVAVTTTTVPPPGKFPVPQVSESPVLLSPRQIPQFRLVSQPQVVQLTSPSQRSGSSLQSKVTQNSIVSKESLSPLFPKESIGSLFPKESTGPLVHRQPSLSQSDSPGGKTRDPNFLLGEHMLNGKWEMQEKKGTQGQQEMRNKKWEVDVVSGFNGIADTVSGFDGTVDTVSGFDGTVDTVSGFDSAVDVVSGFDGVIEVVSGFDGAVDIVSGFDGTVVVQQLGAVSIGHSSDIRGNLMRNYPDLLNMNGSIFVPRQSFNLLIHVFFLLLYEL
nr:PREDICTED: uncharacterized protein LOC102360364 [Latimeria chalumnae]|eukprot:XP_014340946.1 PREDICTED: uncharacterized protein LOC102360364 [Latimeria chalumnae]